MNTSRLSRAAEPARGVGVVLLGGQPGKHHRPYVVQLDRIAVVDDEELAAAPEGPHQEPQLLRAEIVRVLYRLQDPLERAWADARGALLGLLLARPEDGALLLDEFGEALDGTP